MPNHKLYIASTNEVNKSSKKHYKTLYIYIIYIYIYIYIYMYIYILYIIYMHHIYI